MKSLVIIEGIRYEHLWRKMAGELALRWNQILPSLLNTYEKLKNLGFTYHNGETTIILPDLSRKKENHE